MGKRILFLISGEFPYGTAYAARTRALIKLFELTGNTVTVLCDEISEGNICDFNIISMQRNRLSQFSKLLFYPRDYAKKVDLILTDNPYDLVVCRSMYDRFSNIIKVTQKNKIPIVLESCECYDKKSFLKGLQRIRFYQFKKCWRNSYNLSDGFIVISRYLENHYSKLNKPLVRIPAILDTKQFNLTLCRKNAQKIRLIYSGDITGGKELLGEIICAIGKLKSNQSIIEFNIYGPSQKNVYNVISKEERILLTNLLQRGIIKIHGRIPQYEMKNRIENSDFGIFIRPQRISSDAGFPTKLGEYLSSGLPVITNDTGDISLVLKNEYNGFVISQPICENLFGVLNRIMSMQKEDLFQMSMNARKSAQLFLDPDCYRNKMTLFLDNF